MKLFRLFSFLIIGTLITITCDVTDPGTPTSNSPPDTRLTAGPPENTVTTPDGETSHKIQLSLDILNFTNLLNSSWGVRQIASPAATSPLTFIEFLPNGNPNPDMFDSEGSPELQFIGPAETYIDHPGLFPRWQVQVGLRYFF